MYDKLTNETVAGRKYYALLELDDGTVLTNYGDEAVGITSISLSSTLCGSESVSIGCVNAASATIVLEAGTALENQRFALYLGQEFNGAVEWVPMGIFTGTKAEISEDKLTVEAWDDLYFAGGTYTPSDSATGECTVATALDDVCDQLGIQFSHPSVPDDVTIAGMPTGLTCSAAIGYLAALCGASACMNRTGDLEFRQFEKSGQTLGTDDCYSGGMVFKTSDFTVASLTNTLETETTDDDGETATETTEVERTTGAAGGSIALTNPLMTEDNIDTAWDVVKGFTYRPATLTAVGQIALDVGDVLTVTDASGTVYNVPVMTHTLEYDGGLKSTITAAGESESQQSAAVSGPVAQQIKELTTKVTDTKALASGKNAVYYAAAAPSADDYTLSVNDLWFDTSGGDYAPHYWNGSEWEEAPFGSDALGEGSVIASKIAAGEVTAEKINVADLFAQDITATGTISGLTLKGGSINVNDAFIVDSSGNLTATSATITGTLHAGVGSTIGGWGVTANKIYNVNGGTADDDGNIIPTAVIQQPSGGTYVFAAGGTSHTNYSDCPFRVTKVGKLYATDAVLRNSVYMYDEINESTYKVFYASGGLSFPVYAYFEKDMYVEGDVGFYGLVTFDNTAYFNGPIGTSVKLDADSYTGTGISCRWEDYDDSATRHYIVYRGDDALTAYFGYAGSSTYSTVSVLRGRTVKYQNSSGTTSLSDERLKTDWQSLDDWDGFFDRLKPYAFKYIEGTSGRYHIGMGAQTVEQALLDAGLTTQDFAGLVKYPAKADEEGNGYHGYDEEYGLIYTEFVGLLVDQVQKLKARVSDLEDKYGQ